MTSQHSPTPNDHRTDYEHIGGEEPLRQILTDFIKSVYRDPIIGFFFANIDQIRLIQRELEFASKHLGGPHSYSGRPIAQVHKPYPINRGHFHRRLFLLEQTLRKHHLDDESIQRWLAHDRALESVITNDTPCIPPP